MEHRTKLMHHGHAPDTRNRNELNRRLFLKGMGIACLGFVPLFQACDSALSQEGRGSGTAQTGSASRVARPPIDASAPANTQTATFSLG